MTRAAEHATVGDMNYYHNTISRTPIKGDRVRHIVDHDEGTVDAVKEDSVWVLWERDGWGNHTPDELDLLRQPTFNPRT